MTLKIAAPDAGPTLSDLLSKLGSDLTEESDGWLAHCPAHSDSHQSLRVTVSAESGKIMLKDRAGCSTAKVMESLGFTLKDLALMRADDTTAVPTTTSTDELPGARALSSLRNKLEGYAARLHTNSGSDALVYAATRFGVDPDDARRLGLGFAHLVKEDRLVVPFRDPAGRPLGYQARALKHDAQVRWAGPPNPDGAAWTRVGWFPGGSGWEEVIVTEGPGDALTAAAVGYDALAIRGAGLVNNPANLDQVADWLQGRVAVIAGDGDAAGRQFAAALVEALEQRGVTVKSLPMRDGLDLTDWRAEDPSWFRQGFAKAVSRLSIADATQVRAATWSYDYGDVGASYFLRDKLRAAGRDVKFTSGRGFMQLDNGVWVQRTDAQMHEDVKGLRLDTAVLITKATNDGNADALKAAQNLRKHLSTAFGVESVLKMLKGAVFAHDSDFDAKVHLLAVRNGVIDLRSGELLPHDPNLLITRRVDVDYDPDAEAPRWLSFLEEIFPGQPEMPAYIQRLVGYGITGLITEQVFIVLHGKGATGKSTLVNTLGNLFDAISVVTPFSTFEQKQSSGGANADIAALGGARLVFASEGEQGKRMAEATLKTLTGGDKVTARFFYKDFFTFTPQFLPFLTTNHKPRFDGVDDGLWRRVRLVEFKRQFAKHERDRNLERELRTEAVQQGILAWAVAGSIEWFNKGLQDPDRVTDGVEQYREESDVLYEFLQGEWKPGDGRVPQTELFHSFQDWAEAGNFKDLTQWSSRAFYRAIEERGYARVRSNGTSSFVGLVRAGSSEVPEPTALAVGSKKPTPTPTDNSGADFE